MRTFISKNWVGLTMLSLILGSLTIAGGCGKSMRDLSVFGNNPFEKSVEQSSREKFDAQQSSLTIWHDSYDAAINESQSTGKPILADFTGSDWCHWCVKLKKDVFDTSTFETWARDNVVLLELDYPKRGVQSPVLRKQNEELAKKYAISGYPTVLFLDSQGEVLGKLGYMDNPSDWIESAERMISTSKTESDFAPTGNETR